MHFETTLPAALDNAASAWPDKPAIIEQSSVITFRELNTRARRMARAFIGSGLESGDRFAIWAPNSSVWQITALAGQLAGCILVPLNTRYKSSEANDILDRSGCKAVFYADSFLGNDYGAMLNNSNIPLVLDINRSEDWVAGAVSEEALQERINLITPDSLADVLYTSGTTGAPKGVMCNHGQNLRVFETWSEGVTLNSADQYLIVNPYFHSFGYKAGWLAALIRGATVYPVPVFDLDEVLNLIQSEAISFLPGAPTVFQSILAHPRRDEYDLSSLRCAVTGAASIPVQLVRDMKSILGFEEVYTAYGLTESTGVVSLCRSGDDFETIATTSGQPMDGIEVQTTGSDGRPTAPGQPGEIWVRGFNVMQGYLDDPHATNETITPEGWLKTGDIGEFTESGYLRITDRIKDMYICGGFNCYPAEIENVLLNHVAILDVSVVGVPDERLGEVGHAYIITKPGEKQNEDELITWARDNLANFKVPRGITFLDELPRNASGKVQKFLLTNQ
jgi:acyl-CoA synthetase (AMP-forming)/AMP-acid ligase II